MPLFVVLSIWLPLWIHYYVASPLADDATLTALRNSPTDERLVEIEAQGKDLRAKIADNEVVQQARRLLLGMIDLPNGEARSVTLPFDPKDYDGGTPGGALSMAALIVPATLLRAYELQHDEEFFRQAKATILQFASFERDLATDVGAVRNDHAIAARAGVIVHFWRLYRHREDFTATEAAVVVQHIARCALMLAKPSHFTAATNHGVMQNIALLQIAAAFPILHEAELARQTARRRLEGQMAYYIHPEGVVLEHSPGYHRFGIWLVGLAIRLLDLNGLPEIPGLRDKYYRGMAFLDRLMRPDGSIPRIGDTNGQIVHKLRPAVAADAQRAAATDLSASLADGTRVYAGSGYAISTRALVDVMGSAPTISQSTVYWERFALHGHEVSAEGSFLLWAAGRNWIGNTGYWPYGIPGREESTGWRGGNAPHLVNESAAAADAMQLLGTTGNNHLHLIDLDRGLPGDGRLRTQIVQVSDDSWVILDAVSARGNSQVERVWTLDPELSVERNERGGIVATDRASGWRLAIEFLADERVAVANLYGSLAPFGGWVVIGPRPAPTIALSVSPAVGGQWLATVMTLVAPGKLLPTQLPQVKFNSPDQWAISTSSESLGAISVDRNGTEVHVVAAGSARLTLLIESPEQRPEQQRAMITKSLEAELREYPKFVPNEFYRWRLISWLIGPALVTTGMVLLTIRSKRQFQLWLAFGTTGLWGLLAGWIHLVYFAR